MSRKLAPIWAIVTLLLASILSGCGEEGTTTGPGEDMEEELTTEWDITVQTSGVEVTLQEVFFDSDTAKGWVVGNEGTILHTADKGETWEQQVSGVDGTLYSVYFVDESEGWAVGDSGTVIHTADGGVTWETQITGITEQLRGLFFANSSQGCAVGGGGRIITTGDGGLEWNMQNSGTNHPLEAVDFASPKSGQVVINQGWAVGINGTITHTTSTGGAGRWMPQPVRNMTEPLYGVSFPDDANKGWTVGKLGNILRTSDGGQSWRFSAAAAARGKSLYDVFFISAADGWCVGSKGKLLHSPDGGTWEGIRTETTKDITNTLWGVSFISSSEGWAVGDEGIIMHIEKAQ